VPLYYRGGIAIRDARFDVAPVTDTTSDPLLGAFLAEGEERRSEELLAELLEREARPPVTRVIRKSLRGHADTEDLVADVMLILTRRLREARAGAAPIANFVGYVAAVAGHVCDRYHRRRNRGRFALRLRMRHVLETSKAFEVTGDRCRLRKGMAAVPAAVNDAADPLGNKALPSTMAILLAEAGGELLLETLLTALVERFGEGDAPVTLAQEDLPDPAPAPDVLALQRQRLRLLWEELCVLPVNQRRALLLNLRGVEGEDVMATLLLSGVASMPRLAAVLEIEGEELERIWNELPWEDLRIAEWLGVTRQQVINLRKSARERLRRRTNMVADRRSREVRGEA
jgi:DNA-directed RNA polymerase specialized sigma24 family protein